VVRSPLEPEGQVFLEGERWTATAEDGPIREGENVIVTGVHGLRLEVKREAAEGEPADSTAADERPEGEQ
jgi:membrane-bound serine protease (ClpP class)